MPKYQQIKIGLGGGCHWCTEAIFRSIKGINEVRQGWLFSDPPYQQLSEGVLLMFETDKVSLQSIVSVHLDTHSATNEHPMRQKYRSAFYVQQETEKKVIEEIISDISKETGLSYITKVLMLKGFKEQDNEDYINYYYKDPSKQFCQTYVNPKLKKLINTHEAIMDKTKIMGSNLEL